MAFVSCGLEMVVSMFAPHPASGVGEVRPLQGRGVNLTCWLCVGPPGSLISRTTCMGPLQLVMLVYLCSHGCCVLTLLLSKYCFAYQCLLQLLHCPLLPVVRAGSMGASILIGPWVQAY